MNSNLLYNDIYESDIKLMQMMLKTYGTDSKAWNLFCEFYIDPDGYPINIGYNKYKKIKCTVDGLLSVKRIYEHEGFGEVFIESYTKYRRTPVIFFPSEQNGINVSRYKIFGDRIDHTLFDLKNRLSLNRDRIESCKLRNAYAQPKTKQWLDEEIVRFENYIDWLGLKGIFTNEDYEVYDLEMNDGTIINDYSKEYSLRWSEQYYANIKKKIEEFEVSLLIFHQEDHLMIMSYTN